MKKTLLTILSLLLIVGCSQKPVDETTLIEKDGVMYLPDSDSLYSGEVFTNYSSGEKEYQGTYENGLLVTYSYLNKDGSVKEPVNMETLIDRGGNLFEINGQKPYTGDVFELYDNGNRKLSGKLKGGIKDGKWTEWYKNGQKRFEVTYKDGKNDGLVTWWYENGQMEQEVTYKDGNRDGKLEGWDENGQKWLEKTYKDGEFDGLWTQWYENGIIKETRNYKDGTLHGLYTGWYENGQKRFEVTYKDGNQISSKCWDGEGNECECSVSLRCK